MLTQYRLTLRADRECNPKPEWAYRLYAALLNAVPGKFAEQVHGNEITPISQYLDCTGEDPIWTVNLLGEECERMIVPVLEQADAYLVSNRRHGNQICFTVEKRQSASISDADTLLSMGNRADNMHTLSFHTVTAFKSQKQYVSFPSDRLILQNLIHKWNGCITECPVEIEDDGLNALADGLRIAHFRIADSSYRLHGTSIPGFIGHLTLENRCSGFHREFVNALMIFSEYSGIGIKTTLGMGGVERKRMPTSQYADNGGLQYGR